MDKHGWQAWANHGGPTMRGPHTTILILHRDIAPALLSFSQAEIHIGRTPGNDVVLDDRSVSASHALVLISEVGLTIVDQSRNGTQLNGGPVTEPRAFSSRDILTIGPFTVRCGMGPALAALTERDPTRRPSKDPWLTPSPDGSAWNPADSPEFAAIRAEIDKLQSIQGGAVDWASVIDDTDTILLTQGKDIHVACYQASARFQRDRIVGLSLGLSIVAGILDRFWESATPPLNRPRGRLGAILWLLECIETDAAKYRGTVDDLADIKDLWDSAQQLTTVLCARFPDHGVALADRLRTAVSGLMLAVPLPSRGYDHFATAAPPPEDLLPEDLADVEEPPSLAPSPRDPVEAAASLPRFDLDTEVRHLEVALARRLVEQVRYPLYVLIRYPGNPTLLEQLQRKGLDSLADMGDGDSDMMIDYPRDAPSVHVFVRVRSDEFACDDACCRVLLYRGRDSPRLTFYVTPRIVGPVSLVIEAHVEGELLGSEHVWRVCVERSVTAENERSPYSSQTTPLQTPRHDQPPRQQLYVLLINLFTADKLRRWIGLRDVRWADELPSGSASLDDLAYAVVDTGLRTRRIDGEFFDALIVEFPRFRADVSKIQRHLLDET
jgi:hypothetical protein